VFCGRISVLREMSDGATNDVSLTNFGVSQLVTALAWPPP
jgi:hypothetical protein